MIIRLARKEDAKPLEDFMAFNNGEKDRHLEQDYIACMFSDAYRRPTFVVAEHEGSIIGAAAFSEEFLTTQTWGISWVSVHPDYRNQGLGRKLIEDCLARIAVEAGRTVTVILATYPDKTRLYDEMGFVKGGQDHEGGWVMLKTLVV